jgi:hypothetical protein
MRDLLKHSALAVAVALVAACDKVPLLAPNGSTITLSANATTVPTGGSVGLTAFVTESGGTPVQNGTTVRFTTTLGTVTPTDALTTNGIAVATFQAGSASGVAEVHAISGGAGGTTGSGSTATTANVVKITIGAAAANTISLTASPASVSPNGGSVRIVATVLDTNGGSLAGIPVSFTSDQGSVAPSLATTDSSGQATTFLTTSVDTTVTAAAGTKTATVKVTARVAPGVSITCAPASGSGTNCANVQASASNNTGTVVLTVSKGSGTSSLRDVTLDFGDGSTQALGTLAGGAATVTHTYDGPSGSTARTYTATARAVDVNGESTSAATNVTITPRAPFTVKLTAAPGDSNSHPVTETLTATVTGGEAVRYDWDFGDGKTATTTNDTTTHVYSEPNNYTATVTVTTSDGRTGTGRVEFNVK